MKACQERKERVNWWEIAVAVLSYLPAGGGKEEETAAENGFMGGYVCEYTDANMAQPPRRHAENHIHIGLACRAGAAFTDSGAVYGHGHGGENQSPGVGGHGAYHHHDLAG